MLSLNGFDGTSTTSNISQTDTFHTDGVRRIRHVSSLEDHVDSSTDNTVCNFVSEAAKNSVPPIRMKYDGHMSDTQPVFLDEISGSSGENAGKEGNLLDNCGLLPNNCLPCLASTVSPVEKRRSLSSSPPSTRKKAALKLSFKWREEHTAATLRECI